MGFPATLKDANGVPISSVYIPGVGWAALQGSTTSNTDANGTSAPAEVEIALMNGVAPLMGSKGQMTTEDFIAYQVKLGNGFSATTGLISTGAANAFVCMQLAVNNIANKVLIYSIAVYNTNVANDIRVYTANVATADSNLSALTAYNTRPKSPTTSLLTTIAGSAASTTQTTGFTGNQSAGYGSAGNNTQQLLLNGSIYYFAIGDTASVEVANKIITSGNSATITARWIEWT